MTEEELYNEYRKSDCKSFTDFLINKITELKKTYSKQRNKRIDDLQKKNAELRTRLEALEGQTPWKDIKDKSEVIGQLATAKKIISEYIDILRGVNFSKSWKKTQEEAKKFIYGEGYSDCSMKIAQDGASEMWHLD